MFTQKLFIFALLSVSVQQQKKNLILVSEYEARTCALFVVVHLLYFNSSFKFRANIQTNEDTTEQIFFFYRTVDYMISVFGV